MKYENDFLRGLIMAKKQNRKSVETLTHEEASRKNIPTAEFHSVMHKEDQSPIRVAKIS
jgi:adenine-specific DNA-methyltransferase